MRYVNLSTLLVYRLVSKKVETLQLSAKIRSLVRVPDTLIIDICQQNM